MTAKLDIWNMALGHIGESEQIQSPTERTKAAAQCRRFYDTSRRSMLENFPWTFAQRALPLALVSDAPKIGYGFTYQKPVDSVRIWSVCPESGVRPWLSMGADLWLRQNEGYGLVMPQVPWRVLGQQLLTDLEDAYAIYIADVEDTLQFPPLFVGALSWTLAAEIAPPMLGAQGITAAERIAAQAAQIRDQAWASSLNQQGADPAMVSPAIQARW